MAMVDERLAPDVEDGEVADLGAEVARIGGDRAQRVGDGLEEETVDDGLVVGGDLGDRRGHGEDDVEVLGGQQVRPSSFEPRGAGQRLTRRTVAVAAGVVPDPPMAAVVALLDSWPPRAAVRHCSMAVITRRWAVERAAPSSARKSSP